jgi:aspartyl protease family protein
MRAGLHPEASITSSTAGGEARGHLARADLWLEGGIRARGLRVTVLPDLEAPLLGMDMLSKMRFSQHNGTLRIEPPR